MDARRFDALTRHLGSPITRRTVQAALAGAGSLAVLARFGRDADAKKKSKKKPACRRPNTKCGAKGCCKPTQVCANGKCAAGCRFTTDQQAKTMTLQADCTTTSAIIIPNGFRLDGNGKTIDLAGPRSSFKAVVPGLPAAVVAKDGQASIEGLTIDGDGLTGACPLNGVSGVLYHETSGQIKDVTITNLACGFGIFARSLSPAPRQAVDVLNPSIANVNPGGDNFNRGAITFSSGVDGTVTGGEIRPAASDMGVLVDEGATGKIDGVTIADAAWGVAADNSSGQLEVRNCQITGVRNGVGSGAAATTIANNIITGRGATSERSAGVWLISGGPGTVEGNTISNFFDTNPGTTSCGILALETAGAVTIGANTFPDPPGNEQDVCDNRP